jgi:hypothetical protein
MNERMRYAEYLAEAREQVCGHCPERAPDRPPLGRRCRHCGVQLQLPRLVEAIQAADLAEYGPAPGRDVVCARCVHLDCPTCPCPAGEQTGWVVRAVKDVDARREQRSLLQRRFGPHPAAARAPIGALIRAYEAATGTGVYCD